MQSEKEKLIKEMLMISTCTSWWREEMAKTLKELKLIEDSMVLNPYSTRKYEELKAKEQYLIKKGAFEAREMINFRKKCFKKLNP